MIILYHVLFIDDDENILQINKMYFEYRGYKVSTATTAKKAKELVNTYDFDCIVLDIILTTLDDGYKLGKELKTVTTAPIVFLSSLTEQDFIYRGFTVGGEDYLTKPYDVKELVMRVDAHIRRYRGNAHHEEVISAPPLHINLTSHTVTLNGENVALTSVEFKILVLLCESPGKPFSPAEIYSEVWKMPDINATHTVHSHIGRMRKKLDSVYPEHQLIQTEWGKGYVFVPTNL